MSDSVLVRFPDELAAEMRESAQAQGKSMTAFINDAVRMYLDRLAEGRPERKALRARRLSQFAVKMADLRELLREASDPEEGRSSITRALAAIADCLELIPLEGEEISDPLIWQHFRSSQLNKSKSDEEAHRMFASACAEIESRPWTWYLKASSSDAEAKILWMQQRRRLGLPIPPEQQR